MSKAQKHNTAISLALSTFHESEVLKTFKIIITLTMIPEKVRTDMWIFNIFNVLFQFPIKLKLQNHNKIKFIYKNDHIPCAMNDMKPPKRVNRFGLC